MDDDLIPISKKDAETKEGRILKNFLKGGEPKLIPENCSTLQEDFLFLILASLGAYLVVSLVFLILVFVAIFFIQGVIKVCLQGQGKSS